MNHRRSRKANRALDSLRAKALPSKRLGKSPKNRIRKVIAGAVFWALLIVAQRVHVLFIDGKDLSKRASAQLQDRVDIPARRGRILDRRGRELAVSISAYSIGVRGEVVKDPHAVAQRLSDALGLPRSAVIAKIRKRNHQWIQRKATSEDADRVRNLGLAPGVLNIKEEPRRIYPYGHLGAQVLGIVDIDHNGKYGLERRFDLELRGTPGLGHLRRHQVQKTLFHRPASPPIAGSDLLLDLDIGIQSIAEDELAKAALATGSKAGAVVLLRPDGRVLSIASWPPIDPNEGIRSEEDYFALSNFAITFMVEPGSTFKVLTMAAALEEGVVDLGDKFHGEGGAIRIGRRRIRDHKNFELISTSEILSHSSNIGIIKVGARLGARRFHAYVRRLGFGAPTGISLPNEIPGRLSSVSSWDASELASVSMGQGIGVNCLQIARLFAAIANGGELVTPHLVRGLRRSDGSVEVLEKEAAVRVFSAETASTMQGILEQVVDTGTGQLARIDGFRAAGKTGTAQMINPVSRAYADGPHMASFCGFAPSQNAAIVGAVMLYAPQGEYYGGRIAAPVFASIVGRALRKMGVLPSSRSSQRPADTVPLDGVEAPPAGPLGNNVRRASKARHDAKHPFIPDLQGLTMREALSIATRMGVRARVSGSGFAYRQILRPDVQFAQHPVVHVYFKREREPPQVTDAVDFVWIPPATGKSAN